MILVTGATGKLGHFIVNGLLEKGVSPSDLAILARNPEGASEFVMLGIEVRKGDYGDPASLEAAFQGVDKLMFVSSSELGARAPAHRNVVAAAKTSDDLATLIGRPSTSLEEAVKAGLPD